MTGCNGRPARASFGRGRLWRVLTALIMLSALLGGLPPAAQADTAPPTAEPLTTPPPLTPYTPSRPPIPPTRPDTTLENTAPAAPQADNLALGPLSAVLIVGPIDGDNGQWTNAEKANMDLAAAELAANGVTVHKFYAPNTDWSQIKAAAVGAQFVFYRGHGVKWGASEYGGFALSNGQFVSSDDIRSGLRPAAGAIVMIYGCYAAGSSNAQEEPQPISSAEAQRRVAMYSDPFFDVGAGAYYSDWFGDAFQLLVRYLFQGQTLGQAYKSFYDFGAGSAEYYTHPNYPALAMWLDKDNWDILMYNYAFAGASGKKLTDLFGQKMVVSPTRITMLSTVGGAARSMPVNITNANGGALSWATVNPPSNEWIRTSPASGSATQPLQVTLTPGSKGVGAYTAAVRVQAGAANVQNGDQTIQVTLKIVSHLHRVYLPLSRR